MYLKHVKKKNHHHLFSHLFIWGICFGVILKTEMTNGVIVASTQSPPPPALDREIAKVSLKNQFDYCIYMEK